ncbi:multidrug effflux MFS transporter [Enterovibrio nigricans]|uniref:Drug resistance transporter, Bcr/CflA subfamily n=1 Tax=Enterovibrio nigricans DSM 22720 TaxID=1121868 RepID=A0A1T4W444_9GAMM|nr:multidrug effflux MFS transporter [Enterovibrio nigricans]SKA71805.1 drug resistance transporter, Bcr/CflA subfamily [Enterovibrio nigricans DSM 22720]
MKTPPLWLLSTLMMFPQVAETIYSPALPDLANTFEISSDTASLTLSVYFTAFALGVFVWGRLCDVIGRRKAMLGGLLTYCVGCALASVANDFSVVLLARVIAAFGAAVGSVIGQTILRDAFEGPALAKVFSIMGMAVAISPVIGLLAGGVLTTQWGYLGVFLALMISAGILLASTFIKLPETKPNNTQRIPLFGLAIRMAKDASIWRNAILIAMFNLLLFGFYAIAPFSFERMGYSSIEFSYSGFALAAGSFLGGLLNKSLVQRHQNLDRIVAVACGLMLIGSVGVCVLSDSIWLLAPMMLVVMANGIAIPNVLGRALANYRDVAGSAGALFGLMYYLMLGAALGIAGEFQYLGGTLVVASLVSVICTLRFPALKRNALYEAKHKNE